MILSLRPKSDANAKATIKPKAINKRRMSDQADWDIRLIQIPNTGQLYQ
jgi:hypothetical protein